MKLYFDSLTTLKVIHAESPVVIFFGTYGISLYLKCNAISLYTNEQCSSPLVSATIFMSHSINSKYLMMYYKFPKKSKLNECHHCYQKCFATCTGEYI